MSGPLGSSQWMYSAGAASFFSETIDNSVRLVGDATPANGGRFTRTFSTVDSATDFTLNFWIKRNDLVNPVNSSYPQFIFNFRDGTSGVSLNDLCFLNPSSYGVGASLALTSSNSAHYILTTNNLLRDYSAWYNIHIMADMNNSTASERLKFFINGVEASYATDNRASYTNLTGLKAGAWTIGDYYGTSYPIGSSIARWAFVDNSTLAASYFGEFSNGIWVPKAITGITWGSAGHLLDFGQTGTSQDASGIGADTSGQGNHWAVNNIAASDVLIDSPSNNFACLNPLYHSSSQAVLSKGNLKADTAGFVNAANGYGAVSTFAIPKDKKIYIEVECTDGTGDNWFAGFASQSGLESGPSSTNVGGANAITVYNRSVYINGTETDYGSSAGLGGLGVAKLASGDILGCMCDGATGKVWFSRNGSYFKSPTTDNSGTTGDPAGGNHEIGTITNGTTEDVFFVLSGNTSVSSIFVNFGQDTVNVASAETDANGIGSFEYAPPTDYVCLCASSLSEPTIGPNSDTQADDYFNTVLYTGDGTTSRSITGVGFAPDWIWGKCRSNAEDHFLHDTVRGAGKKLESNNTGAEDTTATAVISAFESDGFTGPSSTPGNINVNGRTYVTWNWKAGGTAVSNSDGSITSSVSASPNAGFSIVSWVGNAAGGATVGHSLSETPEMIIVKNLDSAQIWTVWNKDLTSEYVLYLNTTNGQNGSPASFGTHTNQVIGVDADTATNGSGHDIIAYCFHSVEGFSKVGKYEGNSSATDGPFVFTGFAPAFVMGKNVDASGRWWMYDSERSPRMNYDIGTGIRLQADSNAAESADNNANAIQLLSNGFKVNTTNSEWNGNTHLYLAFAKFPFKYANAR